jgi:hypothetical protein
MRRESLLQEIRSKGCICWPLLRGASILPYRPNTKQPLFFFSFSCTAFTLALISRQIIPFMHYEIEKGTASL